MWYRFAKLPFTDLVTKLGRGISSVTENIIMELPQKIPIYTNSGALACNGVSILKVPAL